MRNELFKERVANVLSRKLKAPEFVIFGPQYIDEELSWLLATVGPRTEIFFYVRLHMYVTFILTTFSFPLSSKL